RPYGGWFDEIADALPDFDQAIERVVVDRGELTFHVKREHLIELATRLRDDPALCFEQCASLSGVDYPADPTGRRLHSVAHLRSMTYRRNLRLEVSVTAEDPHLPS